MRGIQLSLDFFFLFSFFLLSYHTYHCSTRLLSSCTHVRTSYQLAALLPYPLRPAPDPRLAALGCEVNCIVPAKGALAERIFHAIFS